MSLFVSTTINDTTQNFFTILTVWTKIVHTASREDNHCPHGYQRGQHVENVGKIFTYRAQALKNWMQGQDPPNL